MIKVKVDDDKYTVFLPTEPQDHRNFRALRYGEEWRDLTGDNLIYNLAYELNEARAENARLRDMLIADTIYACTECNEHGQFKKQPNCDGCTAAVDDRIAAALGDKS